MANLAVQVHPETQQLRGGQFSFTKEEMEILSTALENYWSVCREAEREGEDNVQEHNSAEVNALMKKINGGDHGKS